MDYLNQNPVLYAGLLQSIRRGTADLLEESGQGVFLRDTVSDAFMLAVKDTGTGIQWLKAHEELGYHLMSLFQSDLVDFAKERYGLASVLDCVQAVYTGAEPPSFKGGIRIRAAEERDLKEITEHYEMLSGQEIRKIIQRRELFIGMRDGKMIGFVGQHLEGSIGLLEVLPMYRGNGYGTELESYMIGHMLGEGLIPFGQIECDNCKSLGLQRKLGLTVSEEYVYWLF